MFWLVLFVAVGALLIVLKYIQTAWSSQYGFSSAAWYPAFRNRIDDVSFMMFTSICLTGFCLLWPVHRMLEANLIPGGNTPLSRKHIAWMAVLLVFNWGMYFQAVYRDGGTFLWAFGDGRPVVACQVADSMGSTAQDRDRLGPMFQSKASGQELTEDDRMELSSLREQWHLHGFSELPAASQDRLVTYAAAEGRAQFSKLPEDRLLRIKAASANAKRLAGLQAVEGIVFLFVLTLTAVLGIMTNVYVSLLVPPKNRSDRPLVNACNSLFRVCIVPNVLLGVFTGLGIVTDWNTGIADTFLAGLSMALLWIPFLIAAVRILKRYGPFIELPFLKHD